MVKQAKTSFARTMAACPMEYLGRLGLMSQPSQSVFGKHYLEETLLLPIPPEPEKLWLEYMIEIVYQVFFLPFETFKFGISWDLSCINPKGCLPLT
jgi:hypothetical protein